jgi:hypothetical protein
VPLLVPEPELPPVLLALPLLLAPAPELLLVEASSPPELAPPDAPAAPELPLLPPSLPKLVSLPFDPQAIATAASAKHRLTRMSFLPSRTIAFPRPNHAAPARLSSHFLGRPNGSTRAVETTYLVAAAAPVVARTDISLSPTGSPFPSTDAIVALTRPVVGATNK